MTETEALNLAYKYQCHSTIMEIMAHEIFLQKKLSHAELLVKQATDSNGRIESASTITRSKLESSGDLKDILFSWSGSFDLSRLIESYTHCVYDYEILYRAKVKFYFIFLIEVYLCILNLEYLKLLVCNIKMNDKSFSFRLFSTPNSD